MKEDVGVNGTEKEKSGGACVADAQRPVVGQTLKVRLGRRHCACRRAVAAGLEGETIFEVGARVHEDDECFLHLLLQEGDESLGDGA